MSSPKTNPPRSQYEKILEVCSIIGLIILMGLTIYHWPSVPEKLPHHFNFSGEPDSWGGKGILLFLPILSLILYSLITYLGRKPEYFNYPWEITESNREAQYLIGRTAITVLKTEVIFLFTFMQWKIISVGLGQSKGLGSLNPLFFVFVILTTVAVFIYVSYKNR